MDLNVAQRNASVIFNCAGFAYNILSVFCQFAFGVRNRAFVYVFVSNCSFISRHPFCELICHHDILTSSTYEHKSLKYKHSCLFYKTPVTFTTETCNCLPLTDEVTVDVVHKCLQYLHLLARHFEILGYIPHLLNGLT